MAVQAKIKVSLFATCLVDQLYPEVGVSVVRLLRRLGVEVEYPGDQTCCGQPLFNSGFQKDARKLARRVLRTFGSAPTDGDRRYVVVPSGSCASMVRVFYPGLFEGDGELHQQAKALAARPFGLSECIVKVLGTTDVGASYSGKVAYHPSCHLLRELNVSREPRELISHVKGVEVVGMEQAETCCGFGGTFSVKFPHISAAMLQDKVEDIVRSGASTLVACDMGCLMNISGSLRRKGIDVKPMHLAQLLEKRE